ALARHDAGDRGTGRPCQLPGDVELEVDEVNVLPAQRARLRDPHTRVGNQRDADPVALSGVTDECVELALVETAAVSTGLRPWQLARVGLVERRACHDPSRASEPEDRAQHGERVPQTRLGELAVTLALALAAAQLTEHRGDVRRVDRGEPVVSERGEDVET